MQDRDRLVQDINSDIEDAYRGGKYNNIADIMLTTLTVVGSLAATVLGGAGVYPALVAAVAALPAAFATLQRAVNFRGRSVWYFRYMAQMRALRFELEHAKTPDVGEFAQRRGKLEVDLDKEWSSVINGALEQPAGKDKGE